MAASGRGGLEEGFAGLSECVRPGERAPRGSVGANETAPPEPRAAPRRGAERRARRRAPDH